MIMDVIYMNWVFHCHQMYAVSDAPTLPKRYKGPEFMLHRVPPVLPLYVSMPECFGLGRSD